jgi:hypothetical protein
MMHAERVDGYNPLAVIEVSNVRRYPDKKGPVPGYPHIPLQWPFSL